MLSVLVKGHNAHFFPADCQNHGFFPSPLPFLSVQVSSFTPFFFVDGQSVNISLTAPETGGKLGQTVTKVLCLFYLSFCRLNARKMQLIQVVEALPIF